MARRIKGKIFLFFYEGFPQNPQTFSPPCHFLYEEADRPFITP